jgi:2-polyprenyl-3-methyl-5-hydroxy-6-metoxy-1,4-benzoquinol methylase
MNIANDPPQSDDLKAKLDREAQFWDTTAQSGQTRDPDLYRVIASDRYDRSMPWLPNVGFPSYLSTVLDQLGDVRGQRILDLGCGTGFLSSLLAANGAFVHAVDVSEKSIEVARWRAEISGLADRIQFHCRPAESLGVADAHFDAACGIFVLHHLDLSLAAPELGRVLRPGARAAFIETSAGSPLLMIARRVLTGRMGIEKASSSDEAPLGAVQLAMLEVTFGSSVMLHFPETLFFRMLGYIPPLHRLPAQRILAATDRAIHGINKLRPWSYYAVVSFRRNSCPT